MSLLLAVSSPLIALSACHGMCFMPPCLGPVSEMGHGVPGVEPYSSCALLYLQRAPSAGRAGFDSGPEHISGICQTTQ
jgi:hypothetical protein